MGTEFCYLIAMICGGIGFGLGYAIGATAIFSAYFLTDDKEQP